MQTLSSFLVRYRVLTFAATIVLTVAAVYLASTLKLYDDPNRWPPDDDPAVKLNEELQRKFGGANLVTIMISRKDGQSIVQADTLAKVKRITEFGAFCEIFPGTDGLIHVSHLAESRVEKVTDVLREGDEVLAKCIDIDPSGRIRLSRKEALADVESQEGAV